MTLPARMTAIAAEVLADIDKQTVDFVENYDGTRMQPSVLPAKLPNLLVNGSAGIAVGMATNIPPHHLGEIVDATTALIDDPELTNDELCNYVHGPDFPTGATICGSEGIRAAYATGRGLLTVRAKAAFEESRRGAYNPTYLYYTLGKLEILKLRDEYRKARGASLQQFHDAFVSQGGLPIPLVRKILFR